MNESVKIIGAFILGMGIGALLGAVLTRTKFQEIADAEIEQVKEHYSTRNEQLTHKDIDDEPITLKYTPPLKGQESLPIDYAGAYSGNVVPEKERSHRDEASANAESSNVSTADVEHAREVEAYVGDRTGPYLISPADFAEGVPGFESVMFSYYEEDDTLTDETHEPVEDPGRLVGDALSHFNGELIIYVRNPSLETDFEIERMPGSYFETVFSEGS